MSQLSARRGQTGDGGGPRPFPPPAAAASRPPPPRPQLVEAAGRRRGAAHWSTGLTLHNHTCSIGILLKILPWNFYLSDGKL